MSLQAAIKSMVEASQEELDAFTRDAQTLEVPKGRFISEAGHVPNKIYFLNSGLLRVVITDRNGVEHTTHFVFENEFIADYGHFLNKTTGYCSLQTLEPSSVTVFPRSAIEWGYAHMQNGQKLGRLIAERYFTYLDHRIQSQYMLTPSERYEAVSQIFPNIHQRVPQHMIASYLGITPVHLSRLKKQFSIS